MRPLNLGETLDASLNVVRASWRTLAAVMLVMAVPIQLVDIAIVSATTDSYQVGSSSLTGAGSNTTYADQGAYAAGQVVIQVLGLVGYLLGTVACYRAIADTHLGRPTSARASLRFAARRLSAALWLTIMLVVGLLGAFLALVVPGIFLVIAWSVAFPVLLVEGKVGRAALARSYRLVQGRWWATLGRLAVAYILVTVVTAVASAIILVPALAVVSDTSFAALALDHAANLVVSLVTTPFLAAVTTFVYFDLRVRKEGFDLTRLAGDMGPGEDADRRTYGAGGPQDVPRDAFGNPVVGRDDAPVSVPPPAPGGWAPPVAPPPQRPLSGD
ncbi:hypothetical protein FSW04_04910 [Baekduia soli]|uniref:Glycerophosphoryl diester phosphodiesterase membrane domain-containing protein n=1 Tax=Baekduia soli TaxID=496014 RepID=A0A5B8U1X0_9ACTN|nr:hypothetical protein [Baekduia soli]QEC46993.1 hypothetical protein FSW04_04910 [Baekduia soli]